MPRLTLPQTVRRWDVPLLAVVTVLAVSCAAGEPELSVSGAQAAAPVAGSSQVVVAIRNDGDADDRLVGAETEAAHAVEIHLTEVVDSRASMRRIDDVALPAGETVRFRPGGLHLMLVVPDERVTVGGTFDMTFDFEHSADQTVIVEVVELLDLTES